jgi:type II secretory pathway pseudopilin PulG
MLQRRTTRGDARLSERSARPDQGMTFVEVLVAIVLLGTAVISVLTAVRVTVIATATEREHSRAGQWLESAAKAIEVAPFGDCSVVDGIPQSSVDAQNDYNAAILDVPVPYGWEAYELSVQRTTDIDVWNGSTWEPYSTASACYDDQRLRLQRVRLSVSNPDGKILETLEVVKRG